MPSKVQHGTGETLLNIVWIILNVNMFKLAMDSVSTKGRLSKLIPSSFLKWDFSWNDASLLPPRISSTTFRTVSWIGLDLFWNLIHAIKKCRGWLWTREKDVRLDLLGNCLTQTAPPRPLDSRMHLRMRIAESRSTAAVRVCSVFVHFQPWGV